MRATIPGLAAESEIAAEPFSEAIQEVLSQGMARHDEKACFMWFPNFLKYNRPESPNVVKSWPEAFDMLPECNMDGCFDKPEVVCRSSPPGAALDCYTESTRDLPRGVS
ncbi:MAG TPA: hypothetical protein VGU25_04635 [Acidobacteriaceae bacterium]|nr:hypothetical protein [Acidobacteriaceae bacterium]